MQFGYGSKAYGADCFDLRQTIEIKTNANTETFRLFINKNFKCLVKRRSLGEFLKEFKQNEVTLDWNTLISFAFYVKIKNNVHKTQEKSYQYKTKP